MRTLVDVLAYTRYNPLMLSPVEEIKSRLDIVEFIQGYVRLQKAGVNFRANCPFHGEKTPSFYVTPSRQIWHCFGCGKGGDVFQFLMDIEGQDFPEALKVLATRAGVELTREDPRIRSERNRLYDINEEAAKIFQTCFAALPQAKEYAAKRGLTAETVEKFRIGFAPQSWDFLLSALMKKGFTKDEAERAGLAIKNQEKASHYDRFRSRIMFPITDSAGRVIGFGGRIVDFFPDGKAPASSSDRTEAKYINTPQTMIYDKSAVLYAFDKAKHEIRTQDKVVLVEGYMDTVMSHQAGVTNTVAVSGTALTSRQLQMLKRLCNTMICSFDTDAAGESATRRSLALASEFDFERKVAHIHTGKDPADAVLENPKLWAEAVENAKPVVDFYMDKAFTDYSPATADGKKAIAAMVLPFVADLFDAIQRDHWIKELAAKLDVGEASIRAELERRRGAEAPISQNTQPRTVSDLPLHVSGRRERLEEKFLTLFAMIPPELRIRETASHHIVFRSAENQNIFAMITAGSKESPSEGMQDLEMFTFKSEILVKDIKDTTEEFLICKRELEKECVKESLREHQQKIIQQEKEGNQEAIATLLGEVNDLHKILKQLSTVPPHYLYA